MTGRPTYINRRKFLQQSLLALPAVWLGSAGLGACRQKHPATGHIKGSIVGANHTTGHLLRHAKDLPAPSEVILRKTVIVGGGIAGLSARRWLAMNGHTDVLLLEMDHRAGGNATYGRNDVSAYPWGAHYLPVPDLRNKELLAFLETTGTITGYDAQGLPVYNDYHLCHDPEERLFINGYWQEGIVPETGVPEEEKKQIAAFFRAMETFRTAVGKDGKDAFALPVDHSSQDELFTELDRLSFKAWLDREGYTAPYLRWYLEYGCKDDYGCSLETTSAWAGIHYFAARKGRGSGVNASAVLTWPQGNGFLMDGLKQQASGPVWTDHLVFNILPHDTGVRLHCYDVTKKRTVEIQAAQVLMATPQFVNKHLLHTIAPERAGMLDTFSYAPWAIANITINGLPQRDGMSLCWDNVVYNMPSVGYVNANHQNLDNSLRKVLTWYKPLVDGDVTAARQKAYNTPYKDWLRQIVDELEYAHPGVSAHIEHADVWIWGHGMIAPRTGFIWGQERAAAKQPIDRKIFFAHSDLGGISVFEEAFYQGIRAATELMQSSIIV